MFLTIEEVLAVPEGTKILLPEHPLANVFAVGPDSDATRRELAEQVVGFRIGDKVIFRGRTGTVQTIKPGRHRGGVMFTSHYSLTWFQPDELTDVG
jgi:hypothetical protein